MIIRRRSKMSFLDHVSQNCLWKILFGMHTTFVFCFPILKMNQQKNVSTQITFLCNYVDVESRTECDTTKSSRGSSWRWLLAAAAAIGAEGCECVQLDNVVVVVVVVVVVAGVARRQNKFTGMIRVRLNGASRGELPFGRFFSCFRALTSGGILIVVRTWR